MKRIVTGIVLTFSILSLQACDSEEYERKVEEKDVPPAVLQAFKAAYPNAEVRGYSEESEGKEKLYEISFTNEGKQIDIAYASDGKLLEVEETIAQADLPEAVRTELQRAFPQAEIQRVESILKGESRAYEVKLSAQEQGETKRYELVFEENGKLLKQEIEGEEEEE
ncbi:MAG: PepSY-like domain-containing protein [candidate division KSB1 bacterium]